MKVTRQEFEEMLEMNESMMGECAAFEVTLEQLGVSYDDLPNLLDAE